ncbi:hypothetical protein [Bordetella genomosp. 10]|uniref:hypothetical protein n=1 Tax=Bordetella genomosp. 10 TaxID=1416804 RepID=UPI0015C67DDF|nr:hypothetical protein [Bordetella genomosp. 10]
MAKFTKAFRGVKKGEIYPTQFKAGDDCPPELESAAKAFGAIDDAGDKADEKTSAKGRG